MKRVLLIVAILVLVGVTAVPAASFLQITGPVESSITIKALGNDDCTFDIIDNEDDTPAGRVGRISTLAEDGVADKYIISFGNLAISRNQEIRFGNLCHPVFCFCAVNNNYDRPMRVKLELASDELESLPEGMTIHFIVGLWGDAQYMCIIWKADGTVHMLSFPPNGFIVPAGGARYMHQWPVLLYVKTDGTFSYTGPVSVNLRFVAHSEPPY